MGATFGQSIRGDCPTFNPDEKEHRRQLAIRANASLPVDGSKGMTKPLRLHSVVAADLSTDAYDPAIWEGCIVYVSDTALVYFSDGASWAAI